jgi:hypothetical protein
MTTDHSLPIGAPSSAIAWATGTATGPVHPTSGDTVAPVHKGLADPGKVVSRFAYTTCYYTSYCAVFTAVFVAHFVPGLGPLAAGMNDGAEAARRYVEEMRANSAARKQPVLESAATARGTAHVVA